jgi:bis(5'-nucleosidyl)-tetraphosphatase
MPAPDWYYEKPENIKHRTGAGGIVARVEGGRILIALIREKGDKEFVLPKGGIKLGESLEQAAQREIAEETGLNDLKLLADLGTGERLGGKKPVWQKTHYFLFLTTQKTGQPTDDRDWELHWHDLTRLPELYWREQNLLVEQNRQRIAQLCQTGAR